MLATRTYSSPGRTRSPEEGGGAREAMVLVKECSRWRARVRLALKRRSAAEM